MISNPVLKRVFRSQYFRQPFFVVIIRCSLFLLGLYLYALVIDFRGGINATLFFSQWIELVFLIYFYTYFYIILQPNRWRSLFAALPIVVSYLVQDIYYLVYGKIFRLINVLELPELLQVIPLGYGLLMTVFIVMPLAVFFSVINYRKLHAITFGALPLCMLAGLIVISPNAYTGFIHIAGNGIIEWSDAESVESNGRYAMLFYRAAERLNALTMTELYRDRASYDNNIEVQAKELKQNINYRNVHLIMLESFLDPRLFERVHLTKDPVHPEFDDFFGEKLGLSISPVFGGETAQAEFEVLCGIPALEKLSSIEFNVFTGAPVYCLPGMLNKVGYRTLATNAFMPNYFNTVPAYTGIGFGEIYFPREYSSRTKTYFSLGDVDEEYYIFDSMLFDQNLAFVAKSMKENRTTPIFNYVMTSYGHTPNIIDTVQRPEVVQVQSDYLDDHLQRATNQFYYRTQAIAKYVKGLIKLNKNSLIILISDHLPPLQNGINAYEELHYMDNVEDSHYYNRLMIIENGSPIVYSDMMHYDLPNVIYNYLSDGNFCRQESCAFLDNTPSQDQLSFIDKYFTLMAHASE